ncbi:MAG: transferrin-binding protein-like solute binding protein [Pseudomonadota bacterium]
MPSPALLNTTVIRCSIGLIGLIALSACGGGGGGTETTATTIPSSAFFDSQNTFNVAAQRNVIAGSGIATIPNSPITVVTGTDASGNRTVTLTINGATFTLEDMTPANFNGEIFEGELGNQEVEFQTRFGTDFARVAFLDAANGSISRDLEYVLYGFESSQGTVGNRTGTATYSGNSEAALFDRDQNSSVVRLSRVAGTATFTADFDTNTLSGTARFSAPLVGAPTVSVFDIDFDPAPIAGNGASGTISPRFDASTTTIVGAFGQNNYDATFYGPTAQNVGGEFTFTGTQDGTTDLIIQGNFLGVEQ